jgi:tetratricopeptide (TPR) repeat protein
MKRLLLAIFVLIFCGFSSAFESQLGTIEFPNSGSEAAQENFTRAVLLLHSFEYEDAREAFVETQQIDPDFALAYWGEAMTHNHPLWRRQDQEAAILALNKLAPTTDERRNKTATERERGYLSAVEKLFGEGDKNQRDEAYSEAMRQLSERYPNDLEAKSFYALSILGLAEGVRDFGIYMRAGAVTEEIFDVNPQHPGAVHYMIHSYDDPVHAPLGLRAARVYAKIAPAASHAQHMISHIYVALGEWDESVEANVKSFDVSVERRARKGLGIDSLNYHSLHWLEYSHLQLGQLEQARKLLDQMSEYVKESGSARALWYHAAMRSAWIVETEGADAPEEMDSQATQVTGAAANLFASGYAALLKGDIAAAELAAAQIDGRRESASHGPLCDMTSGYDSTTQRDLVVAEVLQKSLLAMTHAARERPNKAIALLEEATAIEESMPLDFGPPIVVKPSHEIYGELLLKMGRPAEALVQFEEALARAPQRRLSVAGATAAKKQL